MTTHPTVTLPEGMRVMTHEQMRAVHDAVRDAARRVSVWGYKADEISYDALAAAGVFVPPPAPEPGTCTAQFLPTNAREHGPGTLGVWQACVIEPRHEGSQHTSGTVGWHDSNPGAVPANPADKE
ncbi:hypothetical protein [Streptomyces sp. NPDC047525]|uniref:hypothetical protein n=1 Tax=Streptomyces sp. NPDC047525 TaxID=3155264 RepID=UPI0033E4BAB7